MVQVEQNLAICIVLSAIGGILEVVATAVLAVQDARQKQGKPCSKFRSRLGLLSNIVLQIAASMVGNLLAPWYGPVSIVGPTFLSVQLLVNMLLYGSLLGLENFTKDMRIGTCVIVTAAILLPVVGPGVQTYEEDVQELLTTWYAYIWNALLVLGMVIAGGVLVIRYFSKNLCQLHALPTRYAVLLVARATSFAINLSSAKVLALDPSFEWLLISIGLKVVSGAVMTGSIVVQSTAVAQNTFVPLNATFLILVNALTGIFVWKDGRVVESWLGYATVFVQLIVGNYLLLGEFDLFGPQNQRYGRRVVLDRIMTAGQIEPSPPFATSPDTKGTMETMEEEDLKDEIPTIMNSNSNSNKEPMANHMIEDIAAAWLSSGAGGEHADSKDNENEESDVKENDENKESISAQKPSSLARPTHISTGRSSSGGGTSLLSNPISSSRPTGLSKRALTTGGDHAVATTTTTNASTTNATANLSPDVTRPTGRSHRRSHTTGITLADSEQLQDVAHRRAETFGPRKQAWGQVFGVDPSWLERRNEERRMEPIVEFVPHSTLATDDNNQEETDVDNDNANAGEPNFRDEQEVSTNTL